MWGRTLRGRNAWGEQEEWGRRGEERCNRFPGGGTEEGAMRASKIMWWTREEPEAEDECCWKRRGSKPELGVWHCEVFFQQKWPSASERTAPVIIITSLSKTLNGVQSGSDSAGRRPCVRVDGMFPGRRESFSHKQRLNCVRWFLGHVENQEHAVYTTWHFHLVQLTDKLVSKHTLLYTSGK